jgi:phytoene synthase
MEARRLDLYDDPMPDIRALIAYCDATAGSVFSAAAQILAGERAAEISHAGGIAYGITGLLRALPFHAARGQCFLPADLLARHGMSRADILARRDVPGLRAALGELRTIARDHLAEARASVDSLAVTARPAFMPLAVLPLYLAAMGRPDYDPFTVTEVPQWRRQWRLWRESRPARRA